MKIYLNILLILFCNFVFAQDLPVLSTTSLANPEHDLENAKNGNYAKDVNNERDAYVGFWEYRQNGITFQLKIEKKDKVLNKIEHDGQISNYNFFDKLILKYKLIKNGNILFDNLNDIYMDESVCWGVKQSGRDLYGRLLDHTRNVVGSYIIEKISGNPNKLNFKLTLGNYRLLNSKEYYADGQPLFSIPTGGTG